MSRKDYQLIAAAIHRSQMAKSLMKKSAERHAAIAGIHLVAVDLAASLRHDNPRFNTDTFMQACGFAL